ncbi:MAG: YncE family protein [Blastocatellia bacterium]|nr:YncE family protein [Blastocatellia bacterium]
MTASYFLFLMNHKRCFTLPTLLFCVCAICWVPGLAGIQDQAYQVREVAIGPGGSYPYGVALDAGTHRLYAANVRSNNLSVVDTETGRILKTIPVERSPVSVAVNPATHVVYVLNNLSNTISVIDGQRTAVVETVRLGASGTATIFNNLAVNPKTNRIYITDPRTSQIHVLDGATNTLRGSIDLPMGSRPNDLAINPNTNQIYILSANSSQITVIDGVSNTVTATLGHPTRATGIFSIVTGFKQ